jgi:hypothetical protein
MRDTKSSRRLPKKKKTEGRFGFYVTLSDRKVQTFRENQLHLASQQNIYDIPMKVLFL